jgi:hypothetical protein
MKYEKKTSLLGSKAKEERRAEEKDYLAIGIGRYLGINNRFWSRG